ncbi:MAG: hypothetical protein GF313_04640 [Caldithrix sp.]|nr:hypothetical protein [Caldithrix sp.]
MIFDIFKHALMITSFVFIMMLLIEYVNVQTEGRWQDLLKGSYWRQYLLGTILGIIPGCLGAFTVVSLFSHRIVSFGALVAAMIATSGDEAFVMFSMIPEQALIIHGMLFIIALPLGWAADQIIGSKQLAFTHPDHTYKVHQPEDCHCFPKNRVWQQFKEITFPRALLLTILILFFLFLISGSIGPQTWNWKKVTFAAGTLFSLFVVGTVPDHFLESHLWQHVLKKHLLRIFLWTFGVLLVIHSLEHYIDVAQWIKDNTIFTLVLAALIGIIPESGPHMVFVTLFANGSIPLGILLASSIVQDGHGTIPLLAVSKKAFIYLKLINLLTGLAVGYAVLFFG